MSTAVLPRSSHSMPRASAVVLTVGAALAAWLALVFWLGARDAFAQPAGQPPLPIFFAVALPIAVFLIAYRLSSGFRDFVRTLDLRLATGVQAWRFAGLGFLALSTHKVLPAVFAWPAGLGDIAIGATAPLLVLALIRDARFATSRAFVTWNILGLIDLAVAVGIGTLVAWGVIAVDGGVTTNVMGQLPLLLIPAFLVPVFVMLHITALIQAKRRRVEKPV